MRRSIGHALLALMAAGASTPSWSTMTMTTDLTNIRFTVTDLRPDDGQAAGFEWVTENTTTTVARIFKDSYGQLLQDDTRKVDGAFAPLSSQAQLGTAKALVEVGDDWVHAFSQSSDRLMGDAQANIRTDYNGGAWRGLLVAPGTRVTVSADLVFKSTNDTFCTGADFYASCHYASGHASLGFYPAGRNYNSLYLTQSFNAKESQVGTVQEDRPLLLAFENNRNQAVYVGFSLAAQSTVFAPNVPEPSSWALIGAGMAVAGGTLRRRRMASAG